MVISRRAVDRISALAESMLSAYNPPLVAVRLFTMLPMYPDATRRPTASATLLLPCPNTQPYPLLTELRRTLFTTCELHNASNYFSLTSFSASN